MNVLIRQHDDVIVFTSVDVLIRQHDDVVLFTSVIVFTSVHVFTSVDVLIRHHDEDSDSGHGSAAGSEQW